jgi:hypothetical protein
MNLMKSLRNAALAVMLLSTGVANAALYQFTLTGDYTANWQLTSPASPDVVGDGEGFILWDVAGNFPGASEGLADLTFYSDAIGGGLEIYDFYGDAFLLSTDGPQLYTGTEDNPFFVLGTFFLTEFGGTGLYTLTVSEVGGATVPEPATGLMLLGGLGLIGVLRKRRAGIQSPRTLTLAS